MIHTYSVIIQNSKTLESFSQYQPLFAEAMNDNRIGVCKWNESGITIDTALPELRNLTDDKEEWRAIIVRFIDDNCMAACECVPQNPYDFWANKNSDGDPVKVNEVPLVRLTQMLGGVPPLEVKFKPEVIREAHKAPKTIYVPIVDEQREKEYQSLVNKYSFDGKLPSSIIIVSVRKKTDSVSETIGHAWLSHKESESSEFWKRNQYPSSCRFLVYDYETQGPIQREADVFNFWVSVVLLSVNEIDSATLQAYKLYTVNTIMDKSVMTDSFQSMFDRLRDAKRIIDKDIRKDIENQICEEKPLPKYRLEVPVVLKLPQIDEREVHTRSFHLLSDGIMSDLSIWNRQRNEIEENLALSVKSAERILDQTADKMRGNCFFDEDEIEPLNKYQEEDILRETEALYHKIVRIQGDLPTDKVTTDEKVEEITKEIRNNLGGRVVKQSAMTIFIIVTMMLIASTIPAIIQIMSGTGSNYVTLFYVVFISLAIIGLFGFSVLCIQKARLNMLIKRYNQHLIDAFNKLVGNADDYSEYMSAIASHSRGSSYMNLSSRKKHYYSEEHDSKYKHVKAINVLIGKLRNWSRAYHLSIDFTARRANTRVVVDTKRSPNECKLYSFETGVSYPIGINNSGMTIQSPFPFVSRIEILREEIYDDDDRN